MKNQKPKQKTTNGVSGQVSVVTPQLCKLDIEELNKVSGSVIVPRWSPNL